MIPKQGIIPPGGHHFFEGDHKIVGSSFQDVAEQLLKYRVANKLPVGRPLEEVNAYVCNKWPHFCHTESPRVMPRTSEPSFTVAVMDWMTRLWERQASNPAELVPDSVAARRAETCAQCQFQKDWADYGCGSCVESVRRRSYVFRAGKETGHKVTGCSILKQDNTSAVFASFSSLPDANVEQRSQLPHHCWRRTA